MKRILLILLPIIISNKVFTQEVYKKISDQKEYLFIGSTDNNLLKLLDLQEKSVDWIDYNDITQTGRLSTHEFLTKVFNNQLYFKADGDEPFWSAEIRKDSLYFIDPLEGKKDKTPIKIDVNKSDIDGSIVFMFQNKNKTIYGLVRKLGYSIQKQTSCSLCNYEETSLFEIFINYKGHVYKGCAVITQ